MSSTCHQCSASFTVREEDRAFLDKISPVFQGVTYTLPNPTMCPTCRQQERMCWRNVRSLYGDVCDGTGEKILSVFHAESPYTVYEFNYWWSDKWDALTYGQDYDFSRPFFEQFNDLLLRVPQFNLVNDSNNQNSAYVNQTSRQKDCYLTYNADENEKCYYGDTVNFCKDTMDMLCCSHCELCYECVSCQECYGLFYSRDCQNCSDSYFLKDCRSCKNCFGCVNLVNKQYCFLNEQLTKEEYEKRLATVGINTRSGLEAARKHIEAHYAKYPERENHMTKVENCTGDYLMNSQDCYQCYDADNVQNAMYSSDIYVRSKDVMDYDVWGFNAELMYQCITIGENAYNILFSTSCWPNTKNLIYCAAVARSQDLFGCVGLKDKQYCILNKQYTKEEYEALVPKIIEHMKSTGEWGEFIPAKYSPWAFNETLGGELHDLSKEDVLARGWKWYDVQESAAQPATTELPNDIKDVSDAILKEVFVCATSGKNYKFIPQELAFYMKHNIPLPAEHHEVRHKRRRALRRPRQLWEQACGKCGTTIQAGIDPQEKKTVYCMSCFHEETM